MSRRSAIKLAAVLAVAALVLAVVILGPNKMRSSSAGGGAAPDTIRLTGIVRDFRRDHPDFNVTPDYGYGHYAGNIADQVDASRRPVFAGGGYKVTSPWQDSEGRPIAPHLYGVQGSVLSPLGFKGLAVDGPIFMENSAKIDGADGTPARVATNQAGPGSVVLENSTSIIGDVMVGPGGNPSLAITLDDPTAITGLREVLDAELTMEAITPPSLGQSTGDLIIDMDTVIDHDLHVDTLIIENNPVITISGNVTIVCERQLEILNGGTEINLQPGAHLDMYVLGNPMPDGSPGELVLRNGGILNLNTGDPSRVTVYYLGGALVDSDNAFQAYANFVIPNAELRVGNQVRLHGHAFVGSYVGHNNGRFTVHGPAGCPSTNDAAGTAGPASNGGITSPDTFAQWFRDTLGVNQSGAHTITLTRGYDGVYEYVTSEFHPADGRYHGNEGDENNNYFTYAIDARFVYEPCTDQMVEFSGDDDAWIFIDGRLVMDLGGVVPDTGQVIEVDRLGLTEGQEYTFQLFYAQRQSWSSSFRLRTTIPLIARRVAAPITAQFD